ncbi:hypothetical protein A6770_22095 [Nostoc minutum NIES-26]|uniref:OmpA-like domain-containing protein n=1 Tax=Nostoc minutum NIES-26 TaxID=1844469 RepID=A0A367QZ45_9NOSO|nr:hypothetical protein A6770_22095 [Nostoc minutum NIES-26]
MTRQAVKAPTTSPLSQTGILQRKCATCGQQTIAGGECQECKNKQLLQRRSTHQGEISQVPPIVHEVLASSGQVLDPDTRSFMETRFGRNFSQVRIHTDAKAAESARNVNALAYTVRQDIVFSQGQYQPETLAGKKLLAHELAHVVQQEGLIHSLQQVAIANSSSNAAEVEAESVANQVIAGIATPKITPLTVATLQRQQATATTEAPISRTEEIRRSQTSPGEVTATVRPPVISLYNFAINNSDLKAKHRQALTELASLMRRAGSSNSKLVVLGHTDDSGSDQLNFSLSQTEILVAYMQAQTSQA